MAAADIRAGRSYVELYLKNREFLRGLRNARERVKQFGADMRATGQAMAAIGGAGLIGIGMISKAFADFDDQMRAVKAVTQASQTEFEKLTEKAKALGASTSYTASEVAALMAELGRAGFVPDDIEQMTGAVLDLARATGTDATLASGIMAASIRQFSMAAGDATRVADALTAAANGSFNTVEMLGEALSYAGPVASDFNMSIEETLAILGSLGNVGIQASSAGTALRRLLTLNGAEAEKLKGIFGVTFADAAGNARPLVDVLHEVNQATADLGTADRAKKFNEAFGLLGITGASAIGKSAQGAKDLLAAIEAAGGQANRTAKEMDSGLGGALRMMLSAMDGVRLAIGQSLSKPLSGLANIVQSASDSVSAWVKTNQQAVLAVAGVAAGVTIAGVAMMGLGASILAVNAAISLMASTAAAIGAVFTVLASPVTLVTAALGAGVYAWARYTESGQAAVSSLMGALKPFLQTFRDTFGGITDAIMGGNWALAGQVAMAGLRVALLQGFAAIDKISGNFFGKFGSQIMKGDFLGAFNTYLLKVADTWAWQAEQMVKVFSTAARAVVDQWQTAVTSIANMILDISASGGAAGAVMSKVLGVDMNAEDAKAAAQQINAMTAARKAVQKAEDDLAAARRGEGTMSVADAEMTLRGQRERLAAAQGSSGSVTGEAKQIVTNSVGAQADAGRQFVDGLTDRLNSRLQGIRDPIAAHMGEGGSNSALTAAQAELAKLREDARKAIQDSKALADQDKAKGREAVAGAAAAGGPGGMGERVVGSFSAAALSAMGAGGSPMERAAKAAEKTEKAVQQLITTTDAGNEKLLQELRYGGMIA